MTCNKDMQQSDTSKLIQGGRVGEKKLTLYAVTYKCSDKDIREKLSKKIDSTIMQP